MGAFQQLFAKALIFWTCLSACFTFIVHQHMLEEASVFLRTEDYHKYRRPPAEAVSPVSNTGIPNPCAIPPGEDSTAEIGFQGYNLLLEFRYDLANHHQRQSSTSKLLCIFPQLSSSDAQLAGLITYGKSCQGVFIISKRYPELELASSERTRQKIHHVEMTPEVDDSPEGMLRYAVNHFLTDYDWFYLARPGRYLLVERARERIFNVAQIESQPMALKSIVVRELNRIPPEYDDYHDTPELCYDADMFNQAALKTYIQTKPVSVADWVSTSTQNKKLSCEHGFGDLFEQHKVSVPHKLFTEIEISNNLTATQQAAAMHRIYAILHGECDEQWDRVLGALDENGKSEYVHDATYLRKNPLMFSHHPKEFVESVCDLPFGQGIEGATGYEGLQKIKIATEGQDKRVFCMVYTHSGSHQQLRAIAETWGARCDGFFAASNLTDKSIGAVKLLHEGPEQYGNMWLKVRAMWQYAYDHYLNDYDMFHIGGDDHYVIVENLRYMASTGNWKGPWNQSSPLFLGGSLAVSLIRRFCGGGSGYTLNRVALKMLVEEFFPRPVCRPHWRSSREDILIAACFRDGLGLQCMDTNDAFNESRYHPWDIDYHANWHKGKKSNWFPKQLQRQGITHHERLGQISNTSVSFHLVQKKRNPKKPPDSGMRRYHAILYGLCKNSSMG